MSVVETGDTTSTTRAGNAARYLIVSADTHVGPSLEGQLRPYCPKEHLETFDAYARAAKRLVTDGPAAEEDRDGAGDEVQLEIRLKHVVQPLRQPTEPLSGMAAEIQKARERAWACAGQQDPHERLRDMDADGVAADVIFAGGQNGELLPFVMWGGFDQGPSNVSLELRSVGSHIFNAWLADFVSVAPERHAGVMQVAIGDIAGAVREVEWGREAGLRAVNLPAPQREAPPYTDPMYEPFWSACEALDVPMMTHVGGGDLPHGVNGYMGKALLQAEQRFMGRRGLWQLIFGGVFERHPGLKLVFTEQRVTWIEETLADLDSVYFSDTAAEIRTALPRPPSEYWASNCYNSGSFLAPFEVAARDVVGVHNLMWGSDYPHLEGTWPRTQLALRNTFAGVPDAEARLILGENAVKVFGFDHAVLRDIADRIGPTPDDIDKPLAPDEFPLFRGFAFRERGACS